MKLLSGLVACAFLAAGLTNGLAASADTPARAHYKQDGTRCTADEIANAPMLQIRYGSRMSKVKAVCLTKSEWTLEKSKKAEKQVYDQRERDLMNTGGPTAGAAISSEAALSQ